MTEVIFKHVFSFDQVMELHKVGIFRKFKNLSIFVLFLPII